MNYNIIDIIVILILVGFGIYGFKKGLVGNLVGFVSLIASVVLAWVLYPVVADLLVGLGLRDYIYSLVLQRVNMDSFSTTEVMPGFMAEVISNGADTAAVQLTTYVTNVILNIIAFLIVLIVSRIIIFIGQKILRIVVKLPVLNGLNRIGGLIIGLLQGVIVIYIVSMIMFAISPIKEESEIVKESYFMSQMYNKNPVVNSIIKEQLKIEQSGE